MTYLTALYYLTLGLSTLPASRAEKRPTVVWKEYQKRLPTEAEWHGWQRADAVCIVTGAVSGNLLMVDFDQQAKAFDAWAALVPPALLARCAIERSQRGGLHVIVRCTESVPKNERLASDLTGGVLIETRGEGGLFLCAPTAGYELTQGDFDSIPVLTPAEVAVLIDAARLLNLEPVREKKVRKPQAQSFNRDESPADDWNERGREVFKRLLEDKGWEFVRLYNENEQWRRPGKTTGVSASLHTSLPLWTVFSTSAPPFEGGKCVTLFTGYAMLAHGGSESEAARQLLSDGYGGTSLAPASLPSWIIGDAAASPELATDIFDAFEHSILHGQPPKTWMLHPDKANPLNLFSLRPQTVVVLGGAPGAGKTAFLLESLYKAMILDTSIKTLLVNVEMMPEQLLERLLASQCEVPLSDIIERKRTLENTPLLRKGLDTIREAAKRFAFAKPPFTIEAIRDAVNASMPSVVVIDYTQRIRIDKSHSGQSARDKINIIMEDLRNFANLGSCVIAVSALARDRSQEGGHGKNAAAFRDSSEFEYAADDVWILDANLTKTETQTASYGATFNRVLRCYKKRSGVPQDIKFTFDGAFQRFEAAPVVVHWTPPQDLTPKDYEEME